MPARIHTGLLGEAKPMTTFCHMPDPSDPPPEDPGPPGQQEQQSQKKGEKK
jgi:hypothetical protein